MSIESKTTAKAFSKDTNFFSKVDALRKYIESRTAIDVIEHSKICFSFGLPYLPKIFQEVYDKKVLQAIEHEPLTAATISKLTGLPHKYICQVKRRLVKSGHIRVSHLDRCPTTGNKNVQFLIATK